MGRTFSDRLLAAHAIAVVTLTFFLTACTSPPPVPADAQDACPLPAATFAGWFQSGSVSLNGAINPANSLVTLNPDCDFYQWSEQMFMWLTSPAPAAYGGGAHIFDSPAFFDVSPPDASGNRTFLPHSAGFLHVAPVRVAQLGPNELPVIADRSGQLFEFAPAAAGAQPLIRDPSGNSVLIAHARIENGVVVLLDAQARVIKAQHATSAESVASIGKDSANAPILKFVIDRIPIFISPSLAVIDVEQGQADSSVLQAQTAANGSLIYYSTMVNDVYAYFLTGVKDGGITTTTPGQFPTTAADLSNIVAFATAHGKGSPPFPDPNALAIEVKASWVVAAGLPNLTSYITTNASIPIYDRSNPNLWTQTGQQTVQLALVGMHVVGSTLGHPEMVWATFEHIGNTPPATYSYNTSSGTTTVTQNTAGTWLFSASNSSGPFNVPHMSFTGPPSNTVQSDAAFTISPSDTLRSEPWGIDGSNAFSNTEVLSMSHNVLGMMASGDVRGNYFMLGATWTPFGAPPSGAIPGVGTNRLANSTMETYQQGVSNCFTCHQNGLNPDGLSHVYGPLKPLL